MRLVIIDPVQAFIGAAVDMNRANEVRPVFRKLGDEEGFRWVAESSKQIQIFIDTLSATCRLPVHEYFQVSGVSKSRLTDNIEKRIIITRGGISHTNACVGGVGNGNDERLCCSSGQ